MFCDRIEKNEAYLQYRKVNHWLLCRQNRFEIRTKSRLLMLLMIEKKIYLFAKKSAFISFVKKTNDQGQ